MHATASSTKQQQQQQHSGEPWGFDTIAIHADNGIEDCADVAPPIHITTNYKFENKDDLEYSRYDTPTRRRAEKVLGVLEGGHAVLYSSGQAGTTSIIDFVRPKIVALPSGYFGTRAILDSYGDALKVVSLGEVDSLGKGDLIWLETPSNPKSDLYDIQKYADIAHKVGAVLAVDGTFASPVLQKALDHGADFSFHSCTKYIGGHSDVLLGAVIVKDEETAKKLRKLRGVRGNTPGALETYLVLRSMRTLSLRVQRQSSNAKLLAEFLATQEKVAKVYHPILPSHPDHELAKRQLLPPHAPACFSIELKSEAAALQLVNHFKLFLFTTSLGGVESSVDWRYKSDKTQSPALLRLSVGAEDPNDLVADLRQALEKLPE